MKSAFFYRVYGLAVKSEIELPELSPCRHDTPIDLLIRVGEVPEHLDEVQHRSSWFQANAQACLISIAPACRLYVRDGREIIVDHRLQGDGRPVQPADLRLYLLGSAMGAALHQRGRLPLHVSAVHAPSGVWAFTGPSGAGKSTLSATLHLRYGMPLVSDDVSAMQMDQRPPLVFPGPRKLKLWQDAAEHLSCDPDDLVQDLSGTNKFQLYLGGGKNAGEHTAGPQPLHALVLLESSSEAGPASLELLSGAQAFDVCLTALYRPYMAYWYRSQQAVMVDLLALCSSVRIYRFRRHWSLANMDQQLAPLLEAMHGTDQPIAQAAAR
ncbi:MAG: hypothetical protein M0Q42_08005 [Xanthomonadales bacterium]|nr:hypothetical protein [Xanthomonadales bacterium]